LHACGKRRPFDSKKIERQSERERNVGLDPEDDAAKWLREHDAKPPPATPKRASKNKPLHQWRRREER
jgi:hypothetical protein